MNRLQLLKQLWMHPLGHGFALASLSLLAACSEIDLSELLGQPANADIESEMKPVAAHCQIVDPGSRISLDNIGALTHIAKGNSTSAMRSRLGLPYCFVGTTEYYPRKNDFSTWIGVKYDEQGNFDGYRFSAHNPEPATGAAN